MRQCPKCKSRDSITTERRPDGNSVCRCGHSAPTSEFDVLGNSDCKTSNMTFGEALEHLKQDGSYKVTRYNWHGSYASPVVMLQRPDENSKMTEPYLYMEKFNNNGDVVRFPLDLSCESILAEDWMIVI